MDGQNHPTLLFMSKETSKLLFMLNWFLTSVCRITRLHFSYNFKQLQIFLHLREFQG